MNLTATAPKGTGIVSQWFVNWFNPPARVHTDELLRQSHEAIKRAADNRERNQRELLAAQHRINQITETVGRITNQRTAETRSESMSFDASGDGTSFGSNNNGIASFGHTSADWADHHDSHLPPSCPNL